MAPRPSPPPSLAWVIHPFTREPLVLREPGSTTRRVLEAQIERAGVVPGVVMELGSNEAIKHAVAAGLGWRSSAPTSSPA